LENLYNWSLFKEKYSNGNLEITLEEALSWMVSHGDNNLTDI
jgi:beta-lactamase class A